jgi:hypothetical protein
MSSMRNSYGNSNSGSFSSSSRRPSSQSHPHQQQYGYNPALSPPSSSSASSSSSSSALTPQQIRQKLIQSCLRGDTHISLSNRASTHTNTHTHVDLMGVCGFYILTNDHELLKHYPLHHKLAEWLRTEMHSATGLPVNAQLAVDVEIPNGVDSTRDKEDHGKSSSEGDGVLVSVDGETVTMRTSSSGEHISSTNTQSVQIGPMFALTTTADGNCLLHAISICLWGVEDTNTLPGAHAQSSAQSPTQSEASLIRQGLKQFMMFNRDLLFLHYKAAERRFNATLLGGNLICLVSLF